MRGLLSGWKSPTCSKSISILEITGRNFKKSGLISVHFHKDDLIFLVSAKPEQRRFTREVADPVCLLKILGTLPHFDSKRYAFKVSGNWHLMCVLESGTFQDKHLCNIEAVKFIPTNDLIWTRADKSVDFSPY